MTSPAQKNSIGHFLKKTGFVLGAGFWLLSALAAETPLATAPFTSEDKVNALPNIMFVLDDSSSMEWDYLPDWADPSTYPESAPAFRFRNSSYNGVAYNPLQRYRPPAMYDGSGARDTTTYPSMNGQSVAAGGSGTASAVAPNWQAVKVDGYGIQSAATANLEGNAYYYTTVPGEYCTSGQLRSCTASSAATGSYTVPASLRWCTTAIKAADNTATAGTACQASNIANTAKNIADGVTPYYFPRMPQPRTATITFSSGGTVTDLTVGGATAKIISASATGSDATALAAAVALKINACTYTQTGICAGVGYSAVSLGGVVTVTAPTAVTVSPVVTGVAAAVTAFVGSNVPGEILLTVVTPTVTTYPKGPNRSDCAALTTCTYNEEMTNYANWYAYYHTRMQAMKSAASLAFSGVSDKYRVGYFSINNGTGTDFLNVSTFNGTQKNAWYSKFFAARPFGATPIRGALASMGRMYAGKLTTANTVSVTDPMQYSCQQNYTILSTDGYWTEEQFLNASNELEEVLPKQIDGSSPIGNQDGNDPRPYYDGAKQNRTVSRTMQTIEQKGINQYKIEGRTRQIRTGTERLTQSVGTTTTYPKTLQTAKLQKQETPLTKSEYKLESRSYPLLADTRQLEERTYQITRTVRPLERYTYNLIETPYTLRKVETKIDKTVTPLEQKEQKINRTIYQLEQGEVFMASATTKLRKKEEPVKSTTYDLQETVTQIKKTTYALEESVYKLTAIDSQLQKRSETSSNGGETWVSTGWVNVTSGTCEVRANGPGYTRNTECRYVSSTTPNLSTCSNTAAVSPGPTTYSVLTSRSCSVDTTASSVTAVASCNVVSAGGPTNWVERKACGYNASGTVANNQTTCTAKDQTGAGSMSGDKVTCVYESSSLAAASVASCTRTTTNDASAVMRTCAYKAAANTATFPSSCSGVDQSVANPLTWTGNKTVCSYDSAAWVYTASCPYRDPGTAYNNSRITCSYSNDLNSVVAGSYGTYNLTGCSKNDNTGSTGTWSGDQVLCQYNPASGSANATWTNASGSTCTRRAQNTTTFAATQIKCRYASTADAQVPADLGRTDCSAVDQSGANPATWSGDKVTCAYQSTGSVAWAPAASCTWRDPGTAYNNSKITCRYGTANPVQLNQTTCSANDESAKNTAQAGTLTGDKVACVWGTPAAPVNTTSCQWDVPASPTSTSTTCNYLAGTASAPAATCSAVPRGTVTTNGTTWTGPAKECAYATAVVDTNLTTCSPTGTINGTNAYTTCGYGTGVNTPNLNSCTVDAPEAGPSYTGGSTTACAYQGTYSTAIVTRPTTCTPVLQSGTFATAEKQCVYAGVVQTTVTNCTNYAVSGAAPFEGPAVSCAYSTTASSSNLDATTCDANRQTASPYTGPAVDCSYNATPVVTNNATDCTVKAQQAGPSYTGGRAVACAYGVAGSWVDVTVGNDCKVVTTAGPNFKGPARACQYVSLPDTWADNTCTNLVADGPPTYTVLTTKNCSDTDYVDGPAVVTTTVDSCSTDPTSVTDAGTGVITSTATTCAYQAATVADTTSCSARAQDVASPYQTAYTCPAPSDTGYVAMETCPLTVPPGFDASGKWVECQKTDIDGTTEPGNYTTFNPVTSTPTDSCTATAGMDGAGVQTKCPVLINDGPKPVQTCVTVDPPTGPSFIKVTCAPESTTVEVGGCASPAPQDPSWETVTCTAIAGTGTDNTLADVAAYYYKTDLRTWALGNCTGSAVPPALLGNNLCTATDEMNNVPVTTTDTNSAQHMTTFTLGLGASGYMKYSETYVSDPSGDFHSVRGTSPGNADPSIGAITADPGNGICSWQAGSNCNWPFPTKREQTTIDDLWHAGVNGRGAYFNANSPEALGTAITSALEQVAAAGGAAAAPTISSPRLAPADNYIFASTYTSLDWTGQVVRYQIDPFTGVVATNVDWSVQAKLDAKVSRNIYTFDAGTAVTKLKAFTGANFKTNAYFNAPHISTGLEALSQFLCTYDEPCLALADQADTAAAGENLVKYLAGDRTNEGPLNTNGKYYRQRLHVLGDMVNAQVVYVNKPLYDYGDPGYSTFKTNQDSRQAVVYAGANDGMLHAFAAKGSAATEALVADAASKYAEWYKDQGNNDKLTYSNAAKTAANNALAADLTVAQELWAYIPSFVMPNLYRLADKLYRDKHRYFVDATPVVGDVCVSSCNSGSAVWKTILVGGLGRGGRGYYALDITDPASPKALWEFTDSNLGYSYGNPQIAKMADGTWVVMVTSGYNNIPNADGASGDGVGRLFVLNAGTGVEVVGVSPISTGTGDTTTPSGLAKITAQVKNPVFDNTVEAVYGGDLLGNLWRFDINDTVGTTGREAQLLAVLQDGSTGGGGIVQPITTKPEVGLVDGNKVVLVGTGRLLAGDDISNSSLQSFYAIKDTGAGTLPANTVPVYDFTGGPGGVRSSTTPTGTNANNFVRQLQSEIDCPTTTLASICAQGSKIVTSTNYPVSFASNNGWFVDLIHSSERVSTDPVLGLGIIAFNSNVPSLAACDVDGKSYSYFLNYATGGPNYSPGNGNASLNNGAVGKWLANSFASSPALVVTQSGQLIKVSGTPGGIISESLSPPPGILPARRTSWRELISQ